MQFDQDSIDSSLLAFEQFQSVSGLKVNYYKSEIFPIGSIKHTMLPLYTRTNIKWSPQGIKALGIHVSHDTVALVKQNYMPLINKLENIIKIWSTRDLTIYGKTSVIKAHLQSQLVYQMSVLPSPPNVFFDKVEKLFFKYLLLKKPDKIKRCVLYSSREDGGIAMPNTTIQNK